MVGIRVIRGSTGRESPQWNTEDLDDPINQVHLMTAWLAHSKSGAPLTGPHSARQMRRASSRAITGLEGELRQANWQPLSGTYYRGRRAAEAEPLSDFGPPPPGRRARGRFNAKGQMALYTGRTLSMLCSELGQSGPIPGFWAQRFEAEDVTFKILRLTPDATASLTRLHQLMTLAEFKTTEELADPYAGTIALRNLSDRAGFDGIAYPTVRGGFKSDPHAVNVVITSDMAIQALLSSATGDPVWAPC